MGGDFVLPRNPATPVLLIAAGIGITPYMAQLAAAPAGDRDGNRDIVLLYLAKNAAELAYAEELQRSGARVLARLADGSAPPAFMQDAGAEKDRRGGPQGAGPRHRRPGSLRLRLARQRAFAAGRGTWCRRPRVHVDSFAGY